MKNSTHARNESIAAVLNPSGGTQLGKGGHDLAAASACLSWVLTRFRMRGIGNASYLPDLLRAAFFQPFLLITHQLTAWCDTHEPNAAHRLGAWEMHASGLARELVERRQVATNQREAQKASIFQAE